MRAVTRSVRTQQKLVWYVHKALAAQKQQQQLQQQPQQQPALQLACRMKPAGSILQTLVAMTSVMEMDCRRGALRCMLLKAASAQAAKGKSGRLASCRSVPCAGACL